MPKQAGPASAGATDSATAANASERAGRCPTIAPEEVARPRPMDAMTWPSAQCVQRADSLLTRMTLVEKVAQMVQPDSNRLPQPQDLTRQGIGSVLSGGGSNPNSGSDALSWARRAADFHSRALESRLGIPLLYGIDAVHGHNNVEDAVIFPHNIGLGATRDPELVQQVARITAEEVAATSIDWTFAPVMAAARDERWGRTYEAFGETADLAARLGPAAIRGYQGERPGEATPSILACAKHYVADGGTLEGQDQGDARLSEQVLYEHHLRQYEPAVEAKVGSIMVSFSSVNGVKMHCHHRLLTDMLKRQMGFNGFLVSDWEAVYQLPGDDEQQLQSSVNAGVDMFMAPKSHERFVDTLAGLVPQRVPEARIDDAVRRILSVKCELGLFASDRWKRDRSGKLALARDRLNELGSNAHRAVAREAVRQSAVLLKNDGVLPLRRDFPRVHVSGRSADNIGYQSGGWTISWQGQSGPITRGTTILEGIRQAVAPQSRVTFSKDGAQSSGADVAVVVVGEGPYAEGAGDRDDLHLARKDARVVQRLAAAGLPVVLVLITGRPLILGEVLETASAVLVAWLPGSEGGGVSDVLFGEHAPTGKLGHSWPRRMADVPINVGDADYHPLFPYGFGLTYPGAERAPADPVRAGETEASGTEGEEAEVRGRASD